MELKKMSINKLELDDAHEFMKNVINKGNK